MSQSPTFNNRLQELKEGNPTKYTIPHENSFHLGSRPTKKLVIIWQQTGRRRSFLYSNLDETDLDTSNETQSLTLYFMGRTVTLKGYNLHTLFHSFLLDEPFTIIVSNQRYTVLHEGHDFCVTDAVVE